MSRVPGSVKPALRFATLPSAEGSGVTETVPTVGLTLVTTWVAVLLPEPPSSSVMVTVTVKDPLSP